MAASWRFNDGVAVSLVFILAISPLPLGSNRPMFWAGSACIVFLVTTVYLFKMAMSDRAFTIPLTKFRLIWITFATLFSFSALQTLGVLGDFSSVAPRASLLALLRMASYASFFFLVLQVAANPRRLQWMLIAVFLTTVIYASIGFSLVFSDFALPQIFGLSEYQDSATGTFVNRNSFATYLGFGTLTGLALISQRIQTLRLLNIGLLDYLDIRLVVKLTLVVLLLVTLVATNSRMGVSALLFAAISFVCFGLLKQSGANRSVIAAAIAFVAFLVVGTFYLYGGALLERLGSVENDADVRLALYNQVWSMITTRPLTGFGADGFELAFQGYHRLPVSPDLVWDKAHNTYLTNWADYGLIFGSFPILLAGIVFFKLLRVALGSKTNYLIPLLGMAVIVQATLHSTVDFSLEIQANMYLFLAILGMSLGDVLSRRQAGGE